MDPAWQDFLAQGYLPEALVNFVALLGWTPGDGCETMALGGILRQASQGGELGWGAARVESTRRFTGWPLLPPPQFSLPAVHKGNAVVQRARLDHLNGLHLRALLGVAAPPTPPPPPPVSPPAASAAAPAAHAAPAAAAPSPDNPALPLPPLHPPDVPRIRSAVAAALRAELAALHDDGAEGSLDGAAGGEARLDALLREHASKATRLADFTPMLLPYVASEGAFRRVLRPRAWAGAGVEHACGALLAPASTKTKPPVAGEGNVASAPGDSSAVADADDRGPGASAAARLVSRCAVPLAAIADAWRGAAALDALGAVKAAAVASGLPVRQLMMAVRVAVVGSDVGPPLTAVVLLLGRERAAERLLDAVRAADAS